MEVVSDRNEELLGETDKREAERPKWLLRSGEPGRAAWSPGGGSETFCRPTTFTSQSTFLEASFRPAAAAIPCSVPFSSLHLLAGQEEIIVTR